MIGGPIGWPIGGIIPVQINTGISGVLFATLEDITSMSEITLQGAPYRGFLSGGMRGAISLSGSRYLGSTSGAARLAGLTSARQYSGKSSGGPIGRAS